MRWNVANEFWMGDKARGGVFFMYFISRFVFGSIHTAGGAGTNSASILGGGFTFSGKDGMVPVFLIDRIYDLQPSFSERGDSHLQEQPPCVGS